MPDGLNAVAKRLERDANRMDRAVTSAITFPRISKTIDDLRIAAECIRLVAQIRSGDEGVVDAVGRALFAWDHSESKAARDWPTLGQHKGPCLSRARAALRAIGGGGGGVMSRDKSNLFQELTAPVAPYNGRAEREDRRAHAATLTAPRGS